MNVHHTAEVLFRLCANTHPQRDSIFPKGPPGVLDHATSDIDVQSEQHARKKGSQRKGCQEKIIDKLPAVRGIAGRRRWGHPRRWRPRMMAGISLLALTLETGHFPVVPNLNCSFP